MKLPKPQVSVLETASATEEQTIEQIAAKTEQKQETVAGAAFALEEEGYVNIASKTEEEIELTDEGETYLKEGLPEVRLYEAARKADSERINIGDAISAAGLSNQQVEIALANFARKEYGTVDGGEVTPNPEADPEADVEVEALEKIDVGEDSLQSEVVDRLDSRGLITRIEQTVRAVTLTDEGVTMLMEGIEAAESVGQITPELLASDRWKDVEFAEYNVEAAADQAPLGRKHILRAIADRVKEVLVGMGFKEMDGPHVDADFWINDCLFMPQDHPARTHWDRFAMEKPRQINSLPDDLVGRVESAHRNGVGEDGEGYHSPWSKEFASALALRGHTTSLSARHLAGEQIGKIEPPARFFSVEKAYRNDTLDATHLLEFFQIEGWVLAEDLSARDLMGTFEEFYAQFGIHDIQFKPHYNPYTEPSFELFGEHPETGEMIEIGNSGIFRPEMLEPLGVEEDVMAWGLALERLAMLLTGAEDIRDLHGTLTDIEFLRNAEVIY